MTLTANKGEWSELYVLFKLLSDQRIYAGDGNLNKLEAFYPVLSVLRDELTRNLEYSINNDIVIVTEDGCEVSRINVTDFIEQSKILFSSIQNAPQGKGAFEIPSISDFLGKIHCKKIKAKSSDKADIHVVIHDYHTGMKPKLGFSIKSDAGSSPTLLNASKPTTFVYEVISDSFNDVNDNAKVCQKIN